MADLLPPEAAARQRFAGKLSETFASFGYELVTTPLFEHAEVIERGLDSSDRRALLRFVEPESGEVALLRPDITPQIARIIATRLTQWPPPWRIAYRGTIIRRPRGRARLRRQITQAGIELVGWPNMAADAEVIEVAVTACRNVGLERFQVELGQVKVAKAALSGLSEGAHVAASAALAAKDVTRLEGVLRTAGIPARQRRDTLALTELYGDMRVLRRGRRLARRLGVEGAIDELEALIDALRERGVDRELTVDLGELRGQTYYTGMSYQLLAAGPGEPIGAGGRYDQLLGCFGAPQPATGFGLDLDHLLEATSPDVRPSHEGQRIVVMARSGQSAHAVMTRARAAGIACAELPRRTRAAALAFAARWDYDGLVFVGKSTMELTRPGDEASVRFHGEDELLKAIPGFLPQHEED
jgi:ATP phosphoribosyltransferase regulatory subunit